jgi:hypothetical protein
MAPPAVQDVQACNRCRLAKRKCDKVQPICSRCDAAGTTCTYTKKESYTESLAENTSDSTPTGRIVKRRARACMSCNRCHRLKVRCDQDTPCGRCVRSGQAVSCMYKHKAKIAGSPPLSSFTLINENPEFVVATWFLRRRESSYFKALLDRVCERSAVLSSQLLMYVQLESLSALDAPPFTMAMREHVMGNCSTDFSLSGNLPLGSPESRQFKSLDRIQELLHSYSAHADIYITRYFEVYQQSMPVLSPSIFRAKAKAFRDAPTDADASWLAQYLVILGLGAYATNRDEVACADLFYASEACLARTPYMFRPTTTDISTLCLMVLAKQIAYATCWALDTCWNVMGLVVRLSMMMVLHQEWMPQFDEPVIVQEREARRRLWTVVVYLDIQMSLITGQQSLLPQDILLTTTEPRLPSSLEHCFHLLLPKAFPVIVQFLSHINSHNDPVTYEEAVQHEAELRRLMQQYTQLPGPECVRLSLDLFFRRALSVLHGRFALDADAPSLYPVSYWSSLDCNLAMMLHHQKLAESPAQASEILFIARPYMLDFFAAALTTCAHVLHDESQITMMSDVAVPPQQTVLDILGNCVELFGREESRSLCFRTGYRLLSAVYGLLHNQ